MILLWFKRTNKPEQIFSFFSSLEKYNTPLDEKHSFAVNYFNLSYVTLYSMWYAVVKRRFCGKKREFRIHDFLVQQFLHNKMQSEFHFRNELSQIFIDAFQFENLSSRKWKDV